SRVHRPDFKQLVIALLVTPEGFPLTYEIFSGNTADVTTLKTIVEQVEAKHGAARRVWVLRRGITSEENLAWLRERGAHYLVGTPKAKLRDFEQHLTDADWTRASGEVGVKLCPDSGEIYVLTPQRRPRGKGARPAAARPAGLRTRPHQTATAGRARRTVRGA